jgi:hypothetical protein
MKLKTKTQAGFTILEIALAVVVIGLIGTVGFLVYKRSANNIDRTANVTQDTSKADPITTKPEETPKTDTVTLPSTQEQAKPAPAPAPKPEPKTEPKKTYTTIPITLNNAQTGDTIFQFSASWSGSYTGTCALTLKNLSSGAKSYKEASVTGSSCSFETPKTDYGVGEWKYYITFYSKDGTVKGESTYKTFTL